MLLEKLKQFFSLFRTNNSTRRSRLDAAMTECAAAEQDARAKLWAAIIAEFDLVDSDTKESEQVAGEFEQYADMLHEDAMRQRRELLEAKSRITASIDESAAKIDLPPAPPAGEIKAEFTPTEKPAEAPTEETVSQ